MADPTATIQSSSKYCLLSLNAWVQTIMFSGCTDLFEGNEILQSIGESSLSLLYFFGLYGNDFRNYLLKEINRKRVL